jgi:hypothetical protein
MAVSGARSVPRSKLRSAQPLTGLIDGVNTSFSTPEPFIHDPPRQTMELFYNGQRLFISDDFLISESGGPGTGYDTVQTLFAPRSGDKLLANYTAV